MFIETKDLKKTFKTDAGEIQVLKGIDLSIEVGEMVGIVGASGVAKARSFIYSVYWMNLHQARSFIMP